MLGSMLQQSGFDWLGRAAGASALFLVLIFPSPILSAPLAGDFDGDGAIDAADEGILLGLYGSQWGDPYFDPAGDFDGDGQIGITDLALFGAGFGSSGGDPDTTPPDLLVTLNDIPDDMNDLLVVPPEEFQITLHFDSAGGSTVDPSSLVVTSAEDIGPHLPGEDLAPQFSASPTRAVWEIPAGSDLARTSHSLTVSIRDVAGNQATGSYGFAVRDFMYGPPLGNPQTLFLDFDQDRSLGPEIDFLEDLREYGLSSAADLQIESEMRDWLVAEILARVNPYYGRNPDGSPGADPVNIAFIATPPGGSYSRLCVGGAASVGTLLGSATLDSNNRNEATDECGLAQFGIFPQAIDNLWGSDAEYQAAFHPVDPDEGGVPVGEDPLDAAILSPSFDPSNATVEELDRLGIIHNAVDAFAQVVATAIAHENGHMLGLTEPGPAPAGLYGGTSGGNQDHNVTPAGGTPNQNFLMNQGGSFSFGEMAGRGGAALPVFRALNWAYLRDRVALNPYVTGLFPPPVLASVTPDPVTFPGGQTTTVTFHGQDFLDTPLSIELWTTGEPLAISVTAISYVDSQTVTGVVNKLFFPLGTTVYDVSFENADGQLVTLPGGVVVIR
jgi:hypothetical protein